MKAHKGWNICKNQLYPDSLLYVLQVRKLNTSIVEQRASSEESLISDTNMHDMVTAGFSEVQHKLIV